MKNATDVQVQCMTDAHRFFYVIITPNVTIHAQIKKRLIKILKNCESLPKFPGEDKTGEDWRRLEKTGEDWRRQEKPGEDQARRRGGTHENPVL